MLRYTVSLSCVGALATLLPGLLVASVLAQSTPHTRSLEPVKGYGCYRYSDRETPALAKRIAITLAQEQAARSHRVFVKSSTLVKNFQLEEDIVYTTVAEELRQIQIEKLETKEQEVCVTITAKVNTASVEKLIDQKVSAKEIAETAESSFIPATPDFALRVWTNKSTGDFREGEDLIVYLESERDTYVKIDYFQADGTVVHLVPNMYRSRSRIQGGRRYSFGDPAGIERFVITKPFGAETIKVLASPQPFGASVTASGTVSESRSYLRGLRLGLKGEKVVASASVSVSTISKPVATYKATRDKVPSERSE